MLDVRKKIGRNFRWSAEVDAVWRELTKRVGGHDHWAIAAAMVLTFYELPPAERNRRIKRALSERGDMGSFAEWIEEARAISVSSIDVQATREIVTDRPHAPSKPALPPVTHDHPSGRRR